MQSVTVTRTFGKPPTSLCAGIRDVEPFMRAAGFDTVTVEGNTIEVANQVGIAEIELTLRIVDEPDTALTYEQIDGIFETMRTTYTVSESPDGSTVTAMTEFELDVDLIGDILDATIISRQRKRELNAQLDYLETTTADMAT